MGAPVSGEMEILAEKEREREGESGDRVREAERERESNSVPLSFINSVSEVSSVRPLTTPAF